MSARAITDRQYAHLRDALSYYVTAHEMTYADLSRLADMGVGSVAAVVKRRIPSLLFVKRLARALELADEDLLGPPEPRAQAEPVYYPVSLEPPAQPELPLQSERTIIITLLHQCLTALQGIQMETIAIREWALTITRAEPFS